MTEEIWKDIKDYEGLYQVSNYGGIKRFNRNKNHKPFKILKSLKINKYGHLQVSLYKNNIRKNYSIHRLVLEAFVGPCPPGMEGCHNDGKPSNNYVGNLRWDTHKNNAKDSIKHGTFIKGSKQGLAKLNDWKVRIIIRLIEDGYLIQQEIADIFNVTRQTISYIKRKKIWKHITVDKGEI
jgi:hypothetical protein